MAWGVDAAGGKVAFDAGADGTTVTLDLPVVDDRESPTGLSDRPTTIE